MAAGATMKQRSLRFLLRAHESVPHLPRPCARLHMKVRAIPREDLRERVDALTQRTRGAVNRASDRRSCVCGNASAPAFADSFQLFLRLTKEPSRSLGAHLCLLFATILPSGLAGLHGLAVTAAMGHREVCSGFIGPSAEARSVKASAARRAWGFISSARGMCVRPRAAQK